VARWEPNARERLEKASLELFQERGYDRTTVQEIAARAGLTERTFFRYYTDKREVLFGGSGMLQERLIEQIGGAPCSTAPLDAVVAALEATAPVFEARRTFARQRQALIGAHAELRERELIKLASLGAALAEALRRRGVAEPAASLAGEAGIALFRVAFERWVTDDKGKDLAHHIRLSLLALKAVTGGGGGQRKGAGRRASRARDAKRG
jgi:AcrR family transcriptional regulator